MKLMLDGRHELWMLTLKQISLTDGALGKSILKCLEQMLQLQIIRQLVSQYLLVID